MKNTEGCCEMCGYHCSIRQKAHIVAEGDKTPDNILMLCPTCHIIFDVRLKPRLYKALVKHGLNGLPATWSKSIYQQAADASPRARKGRGSSKTTR